MIDLWLTYRVERARENSLLRCSGGGRVPPVPFRFTGWRPCCRHTNAEASPRLLAHCAIPTPVRLLKGC